MAALKTPEQDPKSVSAGQGLWMGIIFSVLFTGLIWVVRPWLPQIDFLPDTGASWYYWKLPEPTTMSRLTAWGFYLAHQLFFWGMIYLAQTKRPKYSQSLQRLNLITLLGNAFFIALHLLQTAIWYDGLAQDVSIWSSQWSVIVMLVLILHLENQRRGLFFGRKIDFLTDTGKFIRRYHGYIFAWGIVYTFWYHPMENTPGHLIGFLYMFLLILQGSLFFTRAHLNKYWTIVLEVAVLFHGTLVAVFQGNGIWPMFLFGFGGIFVITQMYGLGLKTWQRWAFLGVYVAGVLLVYSLYSGIEKIYMITFIPLTEYGSVFVVALLVWVGMKLFGRPRRREEAAAD